MRERDLERQRDHRVGEGDEDVGRDGREQPPDNELPEVQRGMALWRDIFLNSHVSVSCYDRHQMLCHGARLHQKIAKPLTVCIGRKNAKEKKAIMIR